MKELLKEIPSGSLIKKTFHRAFDVCSDWRKCFDKIQDLGKFLLNRIFIVKESDF